MTFEEWIKQTSCWSGEEYEIAKAAWEAGVKAEREACAMVCEAEYAGLGSVWESRIEAASACAKAIRERSGKGD